MIEKTGRTVRTGEPFSRRAEGLCGLNLIFVNAVGKSYFLKHIDRGMRKC